MQTSIDWTKPVRTIGDHLPVRVLCTDANPDYPVVALLDGYPETFTVDGRISVHYELFLENVPPERVIWINVYGGNPYHYINREQAELNQMGSSRTHLIKLNLNTNEIEVYADGDK